MGLQFDFKLAKKKQQRGTNNTLSLWINLPWNEPITPNNQCTSVPPGHKTMSGTVKIDGKANDMAKSISTIQVRNNLLAKNAEQSQVEEGVLYMCTSWVVNFTLRLQNWNHVMFVFSIFVWWRCLRHWHNFLRTYLELRIYFSYSKQETLFLLGCSGNEKTVYRQGPWPCKVDSSWVTFVPNAPLDQNGIHVDLIRLHRQYSG